MTCELGPRLCNCGGDLKHIREACFNWKKELIMTNEYHENVLKLIDIPDFKEAVTKALTKAISNFSFYCFKNTSISYQDCAQIIKWWICYAELRLSPTRVSDNLFPYYKVFD